MQDINALGIGTLLRGSERDYRVERVLGYGSFGITYLASYQDHDGLMVYVALKEFFMNEINGREGTSVTTGSKDGLFANYRRKFAREAKNLASLNHPNIIKVMEYFESNNTSYYAMEYLDGGSLDDYIKQHGALGEQQALAFAAQIGQALSYMHTKGMLHLDLKPKNIMLRGDGTLVLIDFGLSKQYDASGKPKSSTDVGGGTPGYAPIEQANYHDGKDFPVTMDVYAFGATLYKMLTAQTPPDASAVLNNGLPMSLLKSKGVGPKVQAVVKKAMSPMKKDRYKTVGGMARALAMGQASTEEASAETSGRTTAAGRSIPAKKPKKITLWKATRNAFANMFDFAGSTPQREYVLGSLGLFFASILVLAIWYLLELYIDDNVGYWEAVTYFRAVELCVLLLVMVFSTIALSLCSRRMRNIGTRGGWRFLMMTILTFLCLSAAGLFGYGLCEQRYSDSSIVMLLLLIGVMVIIMIILGLIKGKGSGIKSPSRHRLSVGIILTSLIVGGMVVVSSTCYTNIRKFSMSRHDDVRRLNFICSSYSIDFSMIKVDGGTFTARGGDSPQRVTVDDFYIGETEVTYGLWKHVMGREPRGFEAPYKGYSVGEKRNHPMFQISPEEAERFVKKLSKLTGRQFRLPTEAEWEYAARGGRKSRGYVYSGSNYIDNVAWCYDDEVGAETYPVKTKKPNELGLYDMSGNVDELCVGDRRCHSASDPVSAYYSCGGGMFSTKNECKPTSRFPVTRDLIRRTSGLGGFRVVLDM